MPRAPFPRLPTWTTRSAALFSLVCLATTAPAASSDTGSDKGTVVLRPVQVPASATSTALAPDLSEAMIRALRQAAKGRVPSCPGDVPRSIEIGEPDEATAATLREAGTLREAEMAQAARSAEPAGPLLVYSIAGIGRAAPYVGPPRIAAEFRYRLLNQGSGRVLLQDFKFAEAIDGGSCNADHLSQAAPEADRQAATACFEEALAEAFPSLLGTMPAKIIAAAACPPLAEGRSVTVTVDRKPEAVLQSIYYEEAILQGLREAVGSLPPGFPKLALEQADAALSERFVSDGDGKTSEADIADAASAIAGSPDYLLVYKPTGKAEINPLSGVTRLETEITYRLYDVAAGAIVADGKVGSSRDPFTGCASSINGSPPHPLCVQRFVATRLQKLAKEVGGKLVFALAARSTPQ